MHTYIRTYIYLWQPNQKKIILLGRNLLNLSRGNRSLEFLVKSSMKLNLQLDSFFFNALYKHDEVVQLFITYLTRHQENQTHNTNIVYA